MIKINVGDQNVVKTIIFAILHKNYNLKYSFYDNFEIIKDVIQIVIIDTLNKYIPVKKIDGNDFYTEHSAIFLNINNMENIAITYNGIYVMNNFYNNVVEKYDNNSITITNIITSILQYDFNIKYNFKNFKRDRDEIEHELVTRINLNSFNNIVVQKSNTKLKNIYLNIIDKSKNNATFNILITPTHIVI